MCLQWKKHNQCNCLCFLINAFTPEFSLFLQVYQINKKLKKKKIKYFIKNDDGTEWRFSFMNLI